MPTSNIYCTRASLSSKLGKSICLKWAPKFFFRVVPVPQILLLAILKKWINNIFKINSKTGQIVLKKSIKNLKNQIYQFFVRAQDKGFPSLHSEVPVEIYIMSSIDRPPIFVRKHSNSKSTFDHWCSHTYLRQDRNLSTILIFHHPTLFPPRNEDKDVDAEG